MSGQRVILFMGLGALVIAVIVAIAASCLDRPALLEDVHATATAEASLPTPQAVAPTNSAATPTPRPATATPVPVATFRSFAGEIDAALKAGNAGFFRDRAVTQPVVCKPQDVPGQLGGPVCEFAGQEFAGFTYGRWRSEGSLLPLDSALRQIERLWGEAVPGATDQFGDGAPRVFATATTSQGDAVAIMTALIRRPDNFAGAGPLRVVFVSHWKLDGARWRMPYLMSAFVLAEEFLAPPSGDVISYFTSWDRF